MKKICTGPMQFTPYRPWSEERKRAAIDRIAFQSELRSIEAAQKESLKLPIDRREEKLLELLSRVRALRATYEQSENNNAAG